MENTGEGAGLRPGLAGLFSFRGSGSVIEASGATDHRNGSDRFIEPPLPGIKLFKTFFNKIYNLVCSLFPPARACQKTRWCFTCKTFNNNCRIKPFKKTYKETEILLPGKEFKIIWILLNSFSILVPFII